MAERVSLWGRDIDESPADVAGRNASNRREDPVTEPIPVISNDPEDDGTAASYDEPVIRRRVAPTSTTLTFKPAPAPWYRTKRGVVVLTAVVGAAVVLSIVALLLRNPSPDSEEPTNVTPTTAPVPSSVAPTTGTVAPTLTTQPAPPPPPPPPPPTQDEAPVYTRQYPAPRGGPSSERTRPDIDVTRAPISVSPKPVTPAG